MKNKYEKLSLILGILALIEGGIIFWYQKDIKEFKMSVYNVARILSIESNDSTYVTFIKIRNTGNQPIAKDDYSSGLTFNTNNTKILDYRLISSNPSNLHIDFEKDYYNQIKIKPFLFNQNDEFDLQITTSTPIDTLFADVSILGIDKIKIKKQKNLNLNDIVLNDLESSKKLEIINATYGYSDRVIDLTDKLNNKIKNNRLTVTAGDPNLTDIDPYKGKVKVLTIKFRYCRFINEVKAYEGKSIRIP